MNPWLKILLIAVSPFVYIVGMWLSYEWLFAHMPGDSREGRMGASIVLSLFWPILFILPAAATYDMLGGVQRKPK